MKLLLGFSIGLFTALPVRGGGEGSTWPIHKLIYEVSAAYSCLAMLPNGRIGLLFGRDDYGKITFTSFSLDWLASP